MNENYKFITAKGLNISDIAAYRIGISDSHKINIHAPVENSNNLLGITSFSEVKNY